MILEVKVEDRRSHINMWLTLWQSGSNITDREKSLLVEVILRRDELIKSVKEPYLSKMLFDVDSRKIYCDVLDITTFNLTNILANLKSKNVIDDNLTLISNLIPEDELKFIFKYDN